jgi:hypothetical protein
MLEKYSRPYKIQWVCNGATQDIGGKGGDAGDHGEDF